MTFWKMLMLLALIVWVGGIIFFSFVLAPTVFLVLPTTALAGNVVSRSLAALHWMGIVSAVVFLAASWLYSRAKFARVKPWALVNVLVFLMLVLTLISQLAITPRMHVLRAQMQSAGDASTPPRAKPARVGDPDLGDAVRNEFDRLHVWSRRLEGSVLVLGIVVTFLTARRFV